MNRQMAHKRRVRVTIAGLAACFIAVFAGAGACSNGSSQSAANDTAQTMTQKAAQKLNAGNIYPLSQMNGMTDEQSNDIERLLRLNNPNKIGYVYLLTANGQVMSYYTIKGKVSSTSSQILNSQDTTHCDGNNSTCAVVDSMGDDGTWGGEEGGTNGIFFITTNNVLVESADPYWVYSDAPLHLSQPPLITLPLDATPSSVGKK